MEQLRLIEEIKFYEKGRAPFTANSVLYVDVTKLKLRLTCSVFKTCGLPVSD